jgi:hypothetical protein
MDMEVPGSIAWRHIKLFPPQVVYQVLLRIEEETKA